MKRFNSISLPKKKKKKKKNCLSQGERFQNAFDFNNHIIDIIRFLEISPTLLVIRLMTHKEDSQELEIRATRCAIKDVRINVF